MLPWLLSQGFLFIKLIQMEDFRKLVISGFHSKLLSIMVR